MPQGDVKLTRRRSTAESYETRDPNDPKMLALRSQGSGFPSMMAMSTMHTLPEEEPERRLTFEERIAALEQRKALMQQRFQVCLCFGGRTCCYCYCCRGCTHRQDTR